MENQSFNNLTEQERYELSLCGISNAEQLYRTNVELILKDLEKARIYFPDKQFSLNKEKLETLVPSVRTAQTTQVYHEENTADILVENVGPTMGFRRSQKERSRKHLQKAKKIHQQIQHSAVRTSHPWIALFAALSTLLLIISAISVFVLPFMMITDSLPDISLPLLAFVCIVAPAIPYLIFSRMFLCPVCHIRTFSYGSYSRNRSAHYIPGLGYNVSAALHIIFRLRYICPGCGTPIRLTRSKSRTNHG